MPTYEYECKKCGRTFDVFQSITARPLQKCPTCKGKIRRLIGRGAGIIFKGSGFYQTDYRSESYKKQAAEEKKSAQPVTGTEAKKTAAKKEKPATQVKHAK
jgi:putative FmdB family regulatory protein